MDALFCGVDIGSTNVKVLLMDGLARTRWVRSQPMPRVMDAGRPVTDARELVAVIEQLIVQGWRECATGLPLRSIATTGVGEDGLPLDARLSPLDLAIPWFDRRAQAQADVLNHRHGSESRNGVPIDATRTAAKWRWLREHRGEPLAQAATWVALTDYPAVCWSRTPFMAQTLAARTACYDVFARAWMPALLDDAGAPPLPPVLAAGTPVGTMAPGRLTELGAASTRTLIVAGGHDHPLAAAVVRRIDPQAVVDSLGTANLLYDDVVLAVPRHDPYLAWSVPALGGPGVAGLGVFEFAAALAPYRTQAGGDALSAFLAAERAPGEPSGQATLQAALAHCLGQASGPAPELRAVVEASCCYARRMLDALQAAGATGRYLYAVGGWSRSQALVQLRASVMGLPVTTLAEEELTALGAALVARDAVDGPQAPAPVRATRTVPPDPAWQEVYARRYALLRPVLDELRAQALAAP